MFGSDVKRLESLKKLVILLGHLCVVLQVVLLIMVILCILYIIFGVFNSDALNFLTPYADGIINFIVSIFGNAIKESQDGIDGRLVLFVLLGILVVFFIVQLRLACTSMCKVIDKKVVEARQKEENMFNKELEDNMHKDIISQSYYLLAIQIRVKSLFKESLTSETYSDQELEDFKYESINKFVSQIRSLNGITLTREGDDILISSNNLLNLDNIVTYLWKVSDQLKAEYRKKKVGFRAKFAVDCHKPSANVKKVYETIRPLLDLNATNEVLCFGNFRNRYNLLESNNYMVAVKGKYELSNGGEETVWSLVKKD